MVHSIVVASCWSRAASLDLSNLLYPNMTPGYMVWTNCSALVVHFQDTGPSKCLKENHSYASLHQFFLEESIFPIFCSQTANKRTNPLLLHLQEKRNQTGNPLTKSAKSDSLYMENNSSDSPWRIILSNKSSQDKIACPSWIQGFLGLLLCISSMSFAHTGRVRQHKYCHTDYCSCTIWASIHFSFCTSPLWFYWEISAISYLQRQHKSFTKPSHVYSYCAKLSPGVSTCNSQL